MVVLLERLDLMRILFFILFLGFTPFWDYKPTNAFLTDSPGVYSKEKFLNLNTVKKIHLNCDVIDGSVVKRVREPILFSCIIDKPTAYKLFREPETIHYKK